MGFSLGLQQGYAYNLAAMLASDELKQVRMKFAYKAIISLTLPF